MKTAGCSWSSSVSRCLRGRSGHRREHVLGVDERQLVRELRIPRVGERRERLAQELLGLLQNPPDRAHGLGQVVERPVLVGDRPLPVPLVDVCAVVVVEEVVLADRAHVGEQPFAGAHAELRERHPLPLGRGLDHLGVDRMEVAVVGDVEPDRRARAVAVEIVVHAARRVDDQRHLHHRQPKLLAEPVLDQPLRRVEGLHRLLRREQRPVVERQQPRELLVAADARTREIALLHIRHGSPPFVVVKPPPAPSLRCAGRPARAAAPARTARARASSPRSR